MERTFLYHALATGVSGEITLPFKDVIEVQASSAIPVSGGYSKSRVEDFCHRGILSFRSATTITTGSFSEQDQAFNTLVTAVVEGLNILDVVTADRVVARLTSKHPREGGEPTIIPLGSSFENLRVSGCMVDVDLDIQRFIKCGKYSDLRHDIAQDRDFCSRLSHGLADLAGRPERSTILCSLVKEIKPRCSELQPDGHRIHIPHFGTVSLAEFLVTPYSRSISMISVVLGCAVEGHVKVAHGSGNGEPYP